MTEEQLRRLGVSACARVLADEAVSPRVTRAEVRRALAAYRREGDALKGRVRRGERPPAAAEWLLDHREEYESRALAALDGSRGTERLPALSTAGDRLRVLLLAEEAVSVGNTGGDCLAFFEGVQSAAPLSEGEHALLGDALLLALLPRLRILSRRVAAADWAHDDLASEAAELAARFALARELTSPGFAARLAGLSMAEQIFSRNPLYPRLDEESRAACRRLLARRAKREKRRESDCAAALVREAERRSVTLTSLLAETPGTGNWYPWLIFALTALGALAVALLTGTGWAAALAVLPVSEIAKQLVDTAALRVTPVRPLFREALEGGVPPQGRTLCVIPALLTGDGSALVKRLEDAALLSRDCGREVRYALLVDFPDSAAPPDRQERHRQLDALGEQLSELNRRYGGGFCLFARESAFSERDGLWRGWERKRGALLELMRFLRRLPSGVRLLAGEREDLAGIRFLLTLDEDTRLLPGTAKKLIAALLYPDNRPVVDEERRVVISGYGVLQPAVRTALEERGSAFGRIFGGNRGVPPYPCAAGEVYRDLFDRGSYAGKGLLDIDAALDCLDGRFPENLVLSHDLLEGEYLHAGLAGDCCVLDGVPARPTGWYRRLHRWTRGDWQLLPWLFSQVRDGAGDREQNPLSLLSRWKLFDNLRRSLLAPALTALLLAALCCPVGRAVTWTLGALAALTLLLPALLTLVGLAFDGFCGSREVRSRSPGVRGLSGLLLTALVRAVLLPSEAWISLWAVGNALWRMVSRKKLLQWTVSADRAGERTLALCCLRLLPASALGLGALLLGATIPGRLLGLLWFCSPLIGWQLGKPDPLAPPFGERDRRFLLDEAGKLWRYFDTFLAPGTHFLPPDNVQEDPPMSPALRTSPTNLGMALLACLAAVDLCLTERSRAIFLIERQLDTMERLERLHGHFYNWYDLDSLRPLPPRYLSTVDSGNLCAALLALAGGLRELEEMALAARAEALARGMDFAFLYDSAQHLFFLGWDAETGAYTESWYDLYCSEARTASFVAVALGQVEPRHWQRLSRVLVRGGRYTGMASWSGTAFEYFMPQLLLPAPRGSLLRESLAFCAAEQYAARKEGLWGVSESAYFALNADGSYCYHACGVPSLALRRDVGRDAVAPYALALMLPLAPRLAVRALRRLAKRGMSGAYGFYDAFDLSVPGGAPVRTWMVHHQGMALAAISNALRGDLMVRRALAVPELSAYAILLGESLPERVRFSRREERERPVTEIPRKPAAPQSLRLYAAGETRIALTAGGGGWFHLGGKQVTDGLFTLQIRSGDVWRTLFPTETGAGGTLDAEGARLNRTEDGLTVECVLEPRCKLSGLRLRLRVRNHGTREARLRLLLTPMLLAREDWEAHPAFAKLAVVSAATPGSVLFTRRPRNGCTRDSLAALWEGNVSAWDTDRAYTNAPGAHTGAVADPQLTLCVAAAPNGEAALTLSLAAGEPETALRLARGIGLGLHGTIPPLWTQCGLTPEERAEADALLSRLVGWRTRPAGAGLKSPEALWPFGISGNLPIALLSLDAGVLEDAARYCALHGYLARAGCPFDLVLVGEPALEAPLRDALSRRGLPATFGGGGGVHLIPNGADVWETLSSAAVCVLRGGRIVPAEPPELPRPAASIPACIPVSRKKGALTWRWEESGFTLNLENRLPPRRWSHLLSNPRFGALVDECGTGFLWYGNARLGQLTPWQGDPLAMAGGEDLLLAWGNDTCSCFARLDSAETRVTYRAGFARWEKRFGERRITLTAEVPLQGAVRRFRVTAEGFPAPVKLVWRFRPLLGERLQDGRFVRVSEADGAVTLTNPANRDFPGLTLRLSAVGVALTLHRAPDGELTLTAPLPAGGTGLELLTEVLSLALAAPEPPLPDWEALTSPLRVETPDAALNHYLNFWCLYQVITCRLFARTGLYQCGGAYGFRDQLQDVTALMVHAPALAREQLLRAAAHQFPEGDVQHWWHPDGTGEPERGVRTRISDDLLWLPYALTVWAETTGDLSLLREEVGYLESPPLAPGEQERYERPKRSDARDTLYEHGCRAIHCVMARGTGAHGLLCIGAGDWNDGLNRVGTQGAGESVWLTWFASLVLERWSRLAARLGDTARELRCAERSRALAERANRAWDGGWYLRGYDDAGNPFGGKDHPCYQLDSLPQSFSVFAPNPDPERGREAVRNAVRLLYDRERETVALLAPGVSPESGFGYLGSYPEGVRENGGQYTHAAVWLARACYRLGEGETGWRLLRALLPEGRDAEQYQGEPYVLAGDVSAAPGYEGRCGWTWYTGAAAWYYRTAAEELLGLRVRGNALTVRPSLPENWAGYRAELRLPGGRVRVTVRRGIETGILVNGVPTEGAVPLPTDGQQIELSITVPRDVPPKDKSSSI